MSDQVPKRTFGGEFLQLRHPCCSSADSAKALKGSQCTDPNQGKPPVTPEAKHTTTCKMALQHHHPESFDRF